MQVGLCVRLAAFILISFRLSLVARNKQALESVKEECVAGGAHEVLILSQDVGVEEGCQLVVDKTAQYFGGWIILFYFILRTSL